MSKTKVFVAVPTTGHIVDALWYALRNIEERYKDYIEFIYPKHCVRRQFHDLARNALCDEFLDSEADILWFIDSDVVPPDHVLDLITVHGDRWKLAGAPYPVFMNAGGADHEIVYTVYKGSDGNGLRPCAIPHQGVEFVDGMATGCMLIKREVLESMERPFFEFHYDPTTRHMTRGEDIDFCLKTIAKGLQFWTDYSMVCKHFKNNMDLLDLNNYAMTYARKSVEKYNAMIRQSFQAQKAASPATSSKIIRPDSRLSQVKQPIILPGHGSPFASG